MAAQYWAEGVWTGKWRHEQKEASRMHIQDIAKLIALAHDPVAQPSVICASPSPPRSSAPKPTMS